MVELVAWMVFGALSGWIASLILRTEKEQVVLPSVIVGILGALVGGVIYKSFQGASTLSFNGISVLVAVGGAIVFIGLLRVMKRV